MARPQQPFFLIRHGETDWNKEGRFQGQTDIEINATGHAQAKQNGQTLADLDHNWSEWHFVASPLSRTRKTMDYVLDALGLEPGSYATDARLMELTFGDWEGSTLAELEQTIPEAVKKRHEEKWTYRQPNGESYEDGLVRVNAFLAELDRPAVIVSHGGIIRIIRHIIEGMDGLTAAGQSAPQDRVYAFDSVSGRYL